MQSLTSESYTVRSTINAKLQHAAESALQNGLARYETSSNRAQYDGPSSISARPTCASPPSRARVRCGGAV